MDETEESRIMGGLDGGAYGWERASCKRWRAADRGGCETSGSLVQWDRLVWERTTAVVRLRSSRESNAVRCTNSYQLVGRFRMHVSYPINTSVMISLHHATRIFRVDRCQTSK
jgi:hypothetical protein